LNDKSVAGIISEIQSEILYCFLGHGGPMECRLILIPMVRVQSQCETSAKTVAGSHPKELIYGTREFSLLIKINIMRQRNKTKPY